MIKENRSRFFYGYVIVGVALLTGIIIWGARATFGVFLEPMISDLGWSRAGLSGAYSLGGFLAGLVGLIAGRLTDRWGPRLVVTACGLLSGLGYLLMSQVNTEWQLYFFYGVLVAFGMGASAVPLMSTIARWFTKRRATMTGIAVTGNALGVMTIPILATSLIASYEWRSSYLFIGIATLIIIMGAAQLLRRPGETGQLSPGQAQGPQAKPGIQARGLSLKESLSTYQFWILCFVGFASWFSTHGIMVHIISHTTGLGVSAATAATFITVMGGFSSSSRLMTGPLADKIGRKPCLVLVFALEAVALTWLFFAKEVWMFYLFAAIFALGYGGFLVLASPLVADVFGLRAHGTILGATGLGGLMGTSLGPLVTALIFDATGGYQSAFLVFIAVAITALILALLLKPTISEETSEPISA
jgi:MFS family permease